MIIESSNSHSKIFVGINKYFSSKHDIRIIHTNTRFWRIISKIFRITFAPEVADVSMTMMPNLYLGLGKKNIFWLHDMLYFEEELVYGNKEGRFNKEVRHLEHCLRKADIVVVPSKYTGQRVISKFSFLKSKMFVQYCQIDTANHEIVKSSRSLRESIQKSYNLDGFKYIMFIGSPHYRKNLAGVVRAFNQIKFEIPGIKLVVISYRRQDIPSTLHLYDKLENDKDVVLLSSVPDIEMLSLLYNAELLLSPSFEEGFGLPNIEAQIFGVPVIASNISCLPEILGDSAILIDPYSIEDIKSACVDILTERLNVKDLRDMGLKNARRFTQIGRYESLYEKMRELRQIE